MNNKAFKYLLKLISQCVEEKKSFVISTQVLSSYIFSLNKEDIINLIRGVRVIPESISASSTEEKLFTKASDIVLCRTFQLLNYESEVIDKRGDSADVLATSKSCDYSIVADAKSFRMSRTAKNQKDFKVNSLKKWRKNNNYSVIVAPYFQYPRATSQIFEQSLTGNVLLISWEHLLILLKLRLAESKSKTFEQLWNFPWKHKNKIKKDDFKKNYFGDLNSYIIDLFDIVNNKFNKLMKEEVSFLKARKDIEIKHWDKLISDIRSLTKDEAIARLLKNSKADSKKSTIEYCVVNWENSWK